MIKVTKMIILVIILSLLLHYTSTPKAPETAVAPNSKVGPDLASSAIVIANGYLRHQVTVFPARWSEAPEAY